MRIANKILLATLNRDKLDEFRVLFSSFSEAELVPASELISNPEGLSHVEKYNTYLENAAAKARLANHASHYPSLADDSGLEVAALNGKPGVHSHRFAPPQTKISQDQANRELLLSQLHSATDRSAKFICTLVLVMEGILLHSTGILEGSIADSPRGKLGFGYDSLFIPKGSTKTLAEMNASEKNSLSHRAKALHDLMGQAKSHGIVFAKP
jgi:XTP/dITP diphosphohydrolase